MITVIKQGLHDTVQDLGRYGYQRFGVVAGGAMDPFSHRVTNMLVGNEEAVATLELTLVGPHLLFEEDALITIGGGDLTPMVADEPVPMWKPVLIRKGSELRFGAARAGCRAYLAVAGGFDIPEVLGSRSTYVKAGLGGLDGRALRKEDILRFNSSSRLAEVMKGKLVSGLPLRAADWQITPKLLPNLSGHYEILVMRGMQYELFDEESRHHFWNESFTVSSQSDRMGYRINGPTLRLRESIEMVSEAVTYGSIQVPADGNPIILAADRQTTGGYPKVGQISSVDFAKLAQAKAGDQLSFKEVTIEESQRLFIKQEMDLRVLRAAIRNRLR
ncbi:biotin-dependent carboxyltransferase family protein [Sporosarcina highlanderae]|uniref:Biotin-dependent carboxyltransferase family protein n=1 Tax=Sporosarcina highlanderae TaxID=3035916 RepID=A0ABT8JNQ4_9BACL|nr:biotin-dependent carboxyltransferase family protein [Sporosarcina highlanderae]MDN4606433.1 biotin-dependent carboxyltransferase family protein [Sporosarcina highlanderae]